MSITSTPSILFAIKSMLKPTDDPQLPYQIPPLEMTQARDDFLEENLFSVDTEEARKEKEQLMSFSALLAESLPTASHRALVLQFEHIVNERLALVGANRKQPSTVTKKMANMTRQIAKIHAGVILGPLESYLFPDESDAEDHAAFTEIASASTAKTEKYIEEHLKELSTTLLPKLRERSPVERTPTELKSAERKKLKKVRQEREEKRQARFSNTTSLSRLSP